MLRLPTYIFNAFCSSSDLIWFVACLNSSIRTYELWIFLLFLIISSHLIPTCRIHRYVNISEASNVIHLLSLYSHPGYKILSDILFVRTHLRLDLFRHYFLISKYTQFDSQMCMSILSDVIIVEMTQCLGITLKYQKSRLSFEIYFILRSYVPGTYIFY